MSKSLCALLILSTVFLTACASQDTSEYAPEQLSGKFAADDCKFLGGLFKDQNLNHSTAGASLDGGEGGLSDSISETSKDKFTWPWDKTNDAQVSKDRAALRKAHKQKGCAN